MDSRLCAAISTQSGGNGLASTEHPAAPPVLPFHALPCPAPSCPARASLTRTRLSTRTHARTHSAPSSASRQTVGLRSPRRGGGPAPPGAAPQKGQRGAGGSGASGPRPKTHGGRWQQELLSGGDSGGRGLRGCAGRGGASLIALCRRRGEFAL